MDIELEVKKLAIPPLPDLSQLPEDVKQYIIALHDYTEAAHRDLIKLGESV